MLGYWRLVIARAARETWRFIFHDLGRVLLHLCGIVIAAILLRYVGLSEIGEHHLRWEVALLTATAILFIATFIYNLIATPAKMNAEKTAEANRLNSEISKLQETPFSQEQIDAVKAQIAKLDAGSREAVRQLCIHGKMSNDLAATEVRKLGFTVSADVLNRIYTTSSLLDMDNRGLAFINPQLLPVIQWMYQDRSRLPVA